MCWTVYWAYVDPANGGTYENEKNLEDTSLVDAMEWAKKNTPWDHLHRVAFTEF